MRIKTNRLIAGLLAVIMALSMLPSGALTVFAAEPEAYCLRTEEFSLTYTASQEGTLKHIGTYINGKQNGEVYLISLPFGAQLKEANLLAPMEDISFTAAFKGDKYSATSGYTSRKDGTIYLPSDSEYMEDELFQTHPTLFYKRVYTHTNWIDDSQIPVRKVRGTAIQLNYNGTVDTMINTYIIQISTDDPNGDSNSPWEGKGTKDAPYLLKNSEDLKELSDSTNIDGKSHLNKYFRFENDLILPDQWTPIGTRDKRFSGNIDGNGKTLTVPPDSLSLIGTPVTASVSNLNLYGEKIPGYGLVQGYTTSCTIDIENVTILSGSRILYSGFIGGYGNASVNIRHCTVEKGVVIGDDGSGFWGELGNTEYNYAFVGVFNHRDNIGSFAGAFNGSIIDCISYATVYGRHNVGGIVGMKGQSMRDMYIKNCAFYGNIVAEGNASGGIVGSGYAANFAPNSPCTTIQNCISAGTISGGNYVGGIFGGELKVTQCWENGIGYIQNNLFTGTLHATVPDAYVGGIIGYMRSIDKYNMITNNYYLAGTAKQGIGAVPLIDTSCETVNRSDETVTYVTTSKYARKDDPLGADADKLVKAVAPESLADGSVTMLLNKGENSFKNWVQATDFPVHSTESVAYQMTVSGNFKNIYYLGDELDLSGITVTVSWSDGTVTSPAPDKLKITGYDANKRGVQEITLSLGAASATIQVTVLKPAGADITVTISLFGDHIHTEDESGVHTMMGGNLEEWVHEVKYTVSNNATVWDVIQLMLKDYDMTCLNPTGNYIKSITRNGKELGEFTNGSNSGWVYTLNGTYPILGVSEQFLDDGSEIVLHYTDDYVKEKVFAENKKTAEEVIILIDAIGNVTLSSGNAITLARTAYDSLKKEQQVLVTNYSMLQEAEKAYAELITTKEAFEKIYASVGDYIASLGTPNVGSVGGEWMVIGLARSGREVPSEYYNTVVQYVKEHINDKEQLHRAKSTDNSRMILALTALGYDVTNVDGHNLLVGLTDMNYVKKQGINGPIWALLAFDSHGYAIPANTDAAEQVTREKLFAAILDAQLADGGWTLSGDQSDADMTAMAIQALAPYYNKDEKVKIAVDHALNSLSVMQTPTGGYLSWGTLNSESCAQVIVALTALEIDLQKDSRFIKNGCSVLDALMSFYSAGGFRHTLDGELNGMATEQGYYALTAYARFKEGKTSLYNMNDVIIRKDDNIASSDADRNTIFDQNHQSTQTPKPNDNSNIQSPKTGDFSNMVVYFGLMILSIADVVLIALYKRKEQQEETL